MPDSLTEAGFSVWFNSLTDDDQCDVLELLRAKAKELGVIVVSSRPQETPAPHNPFYVITNISTQISLN